MAAGRLSDAYRYCAWINERHYENFPVASWLLPRGVRPHVSAVYAFARSADDFADERKYQGRSLELLDQWRRALRESVPPKPVPGTETVPGTELRFHPIFLALADTIRRFDLPVQLLDDLLTAFSLDVTRRRYDDWEQLLFYCRHSANPIGRLVLLISGIRDEESHRLSDCICTALQMANHWQDLRMDARRDILYVPRSLMEKHGVQEQEILRMAAESDGAPRAEYLALMSDLVGRARALFDEGGPLVSRLKGGLRLEIKLTLLGGRSILDRIERSGYDVFRKRPVLSGLDKWRLLVHAALS